MMDKRSFTESILSRVVPYAHSIVDVTRQNVEGLSDAHAHEDFGKPSVFAVTDLSVEEALPFFRVLHPLTRFGYRVAAVASSQIISCLKWKPQYKYCLEDNVVDKVRPTWKYVVAACSQDSLARLALGLQDTACAKIILQAIWHGIDVYVNLDCLKTLNGTASKNNTLKDLYATYAVNLGNMGIKSVPNGKYLAVLLDELVKINPCPTKKDSNKEIKPEELHVSEKRQKKMVVTQGDIYSFKGKNTTWDLPRDAIITSLAADAAKEAGITLRKTVP